MAAITLKYEGPVVTRAEAKARGLKRYFTGKPCKNGHFAERYVAGRGCLACIYVGRIRAEAKLKAARRAKPPKPRKDPELILAEARVRSRVWQDAHPERMRELGRVNAKRWRDANLERARAIERAYRDRNRGKVQESGRLAKQRKRAADPEGARAANRNWRKNNPDKIRLSNQTQRARRRGVISVGKFTTEDEADLFAKQKGRCPICGKKLGPSYHIDHIMPIVLKGPHHKRNIQLVHPRCNQQKRGKHPVDFARERGRLL